MSGAGERQPTEGPDPSELSEARHPGKPRSTHGAEGRLAKQDAEPRGLRALAARLEAVGLRGSAERWPGFTAEDARIIDAAARELATF